MLRGGVVVLAALAAAPLYTSAGCGDDALVTGGTSTGGGEDAGCVASDCPSFAVYCNDGTSKVLSGCGNADGCWARAEAEASCGDVGLSRIEEFPPGEDPVIDDPGESTSYCLENAVWIRGFAQLEDTQVDDCTCYGEVCIEGETSATCEDPQPGDACFVDEGLGCGDNGTSALVCQGGTWAATDLECLDSPGYCYSNAACSHDFYTCGQYERMRHYSIAGSFCLDEGRTTCSFDLATVHRCVDGTWEEAIHCGEPDCTLYTTDDGVYSACRNGGYALGDLCSSEGSAYCSTDLQTVFVCEGGRTVVYEACTGGLHCRRELQDGSPVLTCGAAGYDVGDTCHFPGGYQTCNLDGTEILTCEDQTMTLAETCSSGEDCFDDVDRRLEVVVCR